MSKLRFWKVESIGNDFVLFHLDDTTDFSSSDTFLNDLAVRVCNRHFGVGSDGLLAIRRNPDASLLLRMFNPDGTEDFCGNGIRCALDHAIRQGWVRPDSMRMSHHGLEVLGRAAGSEIEFQLPPASYVPSEIPMNRAEEAFDSELVTIDGKSYRGSVLSTGTAHTIIPVERLPHDEEFFRVSAKIEKDPLFPARTSVMWAKEEAPFKIALRIWERGAGETQGCGSGSTAAALDYLRRKNSGGNVQVDNPGGRLIVSASSWESPPRVSGSAVEVFTGELLL